MPNARRAIQSTADARGIDAETAVNAQPICPEFKFVFCRRRAVTLNAAKFRSISAVHI